MAKTTEPRWNDLTADEFCSQLRRLSEQVKQMKRAEPLGVIIAAGETAYLAIRKVFPEDTETVKVKPCPYLEKDQCFAIQNRSFPIIRDWGGGDVDEHSQQTGHISDSPEAASEERAEVSV